MQSQPASSTFPPLPRQNSPIDGVADGGDWRARWRRAAAAWMLGAAVVIAPAWPSAAQERSARRPAFERALSWRDFIRMRLSPWLLLQQEMRREDVSRPADEFRADET